MKSQIKLEDDGFEDKIFRNVLYLADYVSKMKVKFQIMDKARKRREKIFEKVRRASKSKQE